jgi:hypothetical protein
VKRLSLFFGLVGVFSVVGAVFGQIAPQIYAHDVRILFGAVSLMAIGAGIGVLKIAHK